MRFRPIILLLALAAGLGAADAPTKSGPAAQSPAGLAALPPSPLTTKMKQIRVLLDEVFKARTSASPVPDTRVNPFRLPGVPAQSAQAAAGSTGGRAGPARGPETEANRLRRLVGSLAFGLIERAGSAPMVSIGSASYKEGDIYRMTDPVLNSQVLLRIRRITGNSVTFGLNNSEYTVTK